MVVVLTTDQKGAIAESAITNAALKLGVDVYRPFCEGGRYDVILDAGVKLPRVQCKWAPLHGDTVVIRCHSNRRACERLRRRAYSADEVDAIAAFCPELDKCFFVPAERFDGHLQLMLRVARSANNQRERINWAEEFDFTARLRALLGP